MKATVNIYASKGQLTQKLLDVVRGNHKACVMTNSRTQAIALGIAVKKAYPDKRAVVIHAENAQQPNIQRMLKNISMTFEHDIDVLIASPSLGTGIDISFQDRAGNPRMVVPYVFGIFSGNVTTHFDCDQQLCRVRHPAEIHVYIDARTFQYECDPSAIRAELDHVVGRDLELVGFDDDGRPNYGDDNELIALWSVVKAVERASINELALNFLELRRKNGDIVNFVPDDEDANSAGGVSLRAATQQRIEEQAKNIANAKDIDHERRRDLQRQMDNGYAVADEDVHAMKKYDLAHSYAVETVTEQLVIDDKDGGRRRQLSILEVMLLSELVAKGKEISRMFRDAAAQSEVQRAHNRDPSTKSKLLFGVPAFDLTLYPVIRELLRSLLEAAGLFDGVKNIFVSDIAVTQASLSEFISVAKHRAADLELVFGLALRADCDEKRVGQLNEILNLVGLRVYPNQISDAGGKKVRGYSFNVKTLQETHQILERREKQQIERRNAVDRATNARDTGVNSEQTKQFLAIVARWKEKARVAAAVKAVVTVPSELQPVSQVEASSPFSPDAVNATDVKLIPSAMGASQLK